MRKVLIIIAAIYFLFLLQFCFFPHLTLKGYTPDLIFAFFFALFFRNIVSNKEVFYYSIFAGFLLDFFSSEPLGTNIFSLFLVFFILKRIKIFVKESNPWSVISLFALAYVTYYCLLAIFPVFLSLNFSMLSFPSFSFWTFLYDLVFVLIFFLIFWKLKII